MTTSTNEVGASVPWTLADVAKAIIFVFVVTAVLFLGLRFLRPVLPENAVVVLVLVAAFSAELMMLFAAWLFGVRKYHTQFSALGFRPFRPARAFGLVLLVMAAALTVNLVYVQVISYLGLDWLKPPPILPRFDFLTGVWRFIIPFLLASVAAPISEESFFRGFAFAALERRFGFWLAATGSGLLFTVAHLQISVLVPIFLLGILLAWLYEQTGSIWPCIALHFTYNSLALVVAFIAGNPS